ncbi:S-layer homology domain-containing protein [Abyssisolibacter fermentans]|uniref:S-layer homology domain-containing protein n=1 Tax=Abyssisolibacter fermentans TaxID=1766203 RepID=UPI000831A2DF|nr:S-layer homology domain-containing protein [Abyssisolibacter fermentans]
MKKRIFLVIFMVLILTSNTIINAQATNEEVEAGNKLKLLGIYKGYEDGSLKLDNNITRAEFTTLAVRLICKDNENFNNTDNAFNDADSHWAKNYINTASEIGLINGYPDGSFKPDNQISNAEVLTVLIRLLGYDDTLDVNKTWPENYMDRSLNLNISDNETSPSIMSTRGNVAVYISRCLTINMKKSY